jgi:hypothetical protein
MTTGVDWLALGLSLASFFIAMLALLWNVYSTRREWARVRLEADTYVVDKVRADTDVVDKVRYVRGTIRNTGSNDIGIENSWFRWRPWALRMNPVPLRGSPGTLTTGEENVSKWWHRARLRTNDIDLRRRGRSGSRSGDVEDYALALLLPAGSVFDFWVVVPPDPLPDDPKDRQGWEELGQLLFILGDLKDTQGWEKLRQRLSGRGRVTLNFRTGRDKSVRAVVRRRQDRAWVQETPPELAPPAKSPRPDGGG